MLLDIAVFLFVWIASQFLVYGNLGKITAGCCLVIVLQMLAQVIFGLYRVRLIDSSLELAVRALGLMLASCIGFIIAFWGQLFELANFRLFACYTILSYSGTLGYRVLYRYLVYRVRQRNCEGSGFGDEEGDHRRRVALVYGAGEIGKMLASQATKGKLNYNIVGFIDDDEVKSRTLILNRPVLGTVDQIEDILVRRKIDTLIIAITELSAEHLQQAVAAANATGAEVKIVPSLFELENNQKQKSVDLRTINYQDLLGRKLIEIDRKPIREMIEGKVVLVTGACGSIGSEICRQVKSYGPKQLLLLDIDESGLHDSVLRLLDYKHEWSDEVFPILCDIKNGAKVQAIMAKYHPDIVFHAAAYKHVPMVQLYPEEGIRTNIGGSYNVLKAAKDNRVKKVVVISTDKAVNPTNVMGATKRVVELEAAMLSSPETEMVCVRFGNVIGSRGSMLPLFLEEIRAGVPITVTDKKIIRYFMAIPEAVSLVFLAGSLGKGGEVMVLDMGQPVNIYEFAKRLIAMYGNPQEDKIVITGLRPGEKMYEELLANKDNTIPTQNKLIFKAKVSGSLSKETFMDRLHKIETTDSETLKTWVKETVPEFREG
jgi:FlaA1/EpsC-like NDP-sugar epimerase